MQSDPRLLERMRTVQILHIKAEKVQFDITPTVRNKWKEPRRGVDRITMEGVERPKATGAQENRPADEILHIKVEKVQFDITPIVSNKYADANEIFFFERCRN